MMNERYISFPYIPESKLFPDKITIKLVLHLISKRGVELINAIAINTHKNRVNQLITLL